MHPNDEMLQGDAFAVDEEAEFSEASMNPDGGGQDLRIAFDRPEYRVMLVANKFQTGFDQPKLVAMYIDKKIANDVEIVQTLSRLNRTFPGKDQVFIIDFVNDPGTVRAAFARYDAGAEIEEVQDLGVLQDLLGRLDEQRIYEGGSSRPGAPSVYIQEIVEKLNSLFWRSYASGGPGGLREPGGRNYERERSRHGRGRSELGGPGDGGRATPGPFRPPRSGRCRPTASWPRFFSARTSRRCRCFRGSSTRS
ncbi:MAG: type I restriction enzyme subunit R domain-containing protein [Alkalilacustris sp.]